ncbi:DUF983 domain-containing protein [Sphingobium chungbukense]|uniref:Zinc-finger protein n=1 Tax=Sphingobium chungbukense TaxID=56193 RepID=A0A0M3AJR8_9SPHN|nr:DUF983 domain-containing protein [Sphingobium chungbukense]KKW90332.1 hypothetical protein YP76_20225 [Sphingobium chungbukense]
MSGTVHRLPTGTDAWSRLRALRAALSGRCPRCSKGRLFAGFLTLRDHCETCGLGFAETEPLDGAGFLVIAFGCFPSVALALLLEILFNPPYWVHFLTSVPVLFIGCLLPLRPMKSWLFNKNYLATIRRA